MQKAKEETQTKANNKAVSENKPLHRFYYIFVQSKIRKERSDFATLQTIAPKCRGRRPRRPVRRVAMSVLSQIMSRRAVR